MHQIGRIIRRIYQISIVKAALLYRESKLKRHVNGIAGRLSNSLNTIYILNDYHNDRLFYFGDGTYIRPLFHQLLLKTDKSKFSRIKKKSCTWSPVIFFQPKIHVFEKKQDKFNKILANFKRENTISFQSFWEKEWGKMVILHFVQK